MRRLADGARVPVTLIGGALGSGKTTLLNRLLAEAGDRRLVVLVNDVGDIAVDAALIRSVSDDVIELTNGCVCCSMTDGLGEALEALRQWADPPDHVVVELSGVAEPLRVAPWASAPGFRLEAVVVCVDAVRVGRQLTDRYLADTIRAQLLGADLLVLTKTDLVDELPTLVAHTAAPILDARSLALEAILSAERFDTQRPPAETIASEWTVASINLTRPIDPQRFGEVLAALPGDVIRLKGFVSSGDATWLVQGVGERRTMVPVSAAIAGNPETWGLVAIAVPRLGAEQLRAVLASLQAAN